MSCQSVSNESVSKTLMEDPYSFEELQFNPWKVKWLEFQLRRSCPYEDADLGRHQQPQQRLGVPAGWGRKGGTGFGGGAGSWLPSVKSPLL